jgi:hypothetical protein
VVLANVLGSFGGARLSIMLPVCSVVRKPGLSGSFETGLPVLTDLFTTAIRVRRWEQRIPRRTRTQIHTT